MEFTYNDLVDKVPYSGNFNVDLLKVLAYLDPNKSSSYDNWALVPQNRETSTTTKCVCGHYIQNQFKAYHMITKDCIIIGSDCMGKFSNDSRLKVNRLVRQLRNPNSLYCHLCLKKTTNGVENKGHHYHSSCLERSGIPKCETCSKFFDCACTKVKCRDCPSIIINKPQWSTRCYSCYGKFKSNSI